MAVDFQSYIDDHLMGPLSNGATLTDAAIITYDGEVLGQSSGFPEVSADLITAIMLSLDKSDQVESSEYITLGGIKYRLVFRQEGCSLFGYGGITNGGITNGGITIRKIKTAIIIGRFNDPVPASKARDMVLGVGDYLEDQGL